MQFSILLYLEAESTIVKRRKDWCLIYFGNNPRCEFIWIFPIISFIIQTGTPSLNVPT